MSFKDNVLRFASFLGLVDVRDPVVEYKSDMDDVLAYVGDDESAEWFTLDDVVLNTSNDERLFCITVDSPGHQFLVGEGFEVPTHNSDEAKLEQEMRDECRQYIGSILRLGRAAGVHLVGATQRPDAKMLPGEMKANMTSRVCAGSVDGTASSMILDDAEGTMVKSSPRGRLYAKNHQTGFHAQGFFVDASWIDEYRRSIGLNPDGSPLEGFDGGVGGSDNGGVGSSVVVGVSGVDEGEVAEGATASDDVSVDDAFSSDSAGFVDYDESEEGEDDGDFEFVPVDVSGFSNNTDSAVTPEGNTGATSGGNGSSGAQTEGERLGLVLGVNGGGDKYHHPEDDWDDSLDELVSENKSFFRGE